MTSSEQLAVKRPKQEESCELANGICFRQLWHAWLFTHVPEYRELRLELAAGWRCKALDRRFTAAQEVHRRAREEAAASATTTSANNESSAATADALHSSMVRKVNGYANWCETTLTTAAPSVFRRYEAPCSSNNNNYPNGNGSCGPPRFLDIGAAPGGMSKFLHSVLGWSGVATSLAQEAGGMPMVYVPSQATATAAAAIAKTAETATPTTTTANGIRGGGSTAALMSLLRRKAPVTSTCANAPAAKSNSQPPSFEFLAADMLTADAECKLFEGPVARVECASCDVVIAGAVQDQTQREQAAESGDGLQNDGTTASATTEAATLAGSFATRMTFTFAQLALAVRAVKRGGALLLVYGPSDCASLVAFAHRVLRLLVPDAATCISVLPTMHVEKTPVYILVSDVLAKGAPIWEAIAANGASSGSDHAGEVSEAQLRLRVVDVLASVLSMSRAQLSRTTPSTDANASTEAPLWHTTIDWQRWTTADDGGAVVATAAAAAERCERDHGDDTVAAFRELRGVSRGLEHAWELRAAKLRRTRLEAAGRFGASAEFPD